MTIMMIMIMNIQQSHSFLIGIHLMHVHVSQDRICAKGSSPGTFGGSGPSVRINAAHRWFVVRVDVLFLLIHYYDYLHYKGCDKGGNCPNLTFSHLGPCSETCHAFVGCRDTGDTERANSCGYRLFSYV